MAPKSVLVTGANRGIGLGLVKKFLEDDAVQHVFATARKAEEASELKKLTVDPRLHIIGMDVTCDRSIEAAYREVEKAVGDEGLNLLVNNAGQLVKYYLREPENRADFARQLDINTISPLIVAQVFLPLLQKAAAGNTSFGLSTARAAIINISSDAGSIAHNEPGDIPQEMRKKFDEISPPMIGYRAALNCITKQLSHDLKADGILVACFCPGWVKTDYGGQKGMLTIEQCANELVPTIHSLKPEQTGGFFKISGERIPY